MCSSDLLLYILQAHYFHNQWVRQGPLIQGDGPLQVADRPVGVGEAIARGQGVGVVRAQHPFAVDQVALVQGDRLAQVTTCPVGAGKIVAQGYGVGVVVNAEDVHEYPHLDRRPREGVFRLRYLHHAAVGGGDEEPVPLYF